MKKNDEEGDLNSFTANYKHQNETHYPYLLACSLARSSDQFEQTRSMKMLGEWIQQYQKLSEMMKHKYSQYIPKIQKILMTKYQMKAPIQFCLSRFICTFYATWKQIAEAIIENLQKRDKYTLQLVWYTCHYLVQQTNYQKQVYFLEYLTTKFEKPLRYYEAQSYDEAQKVIDTAYLMNIYGCQQAFKKNSKHWSNKFSLIEKASEGDYRVVVLIQILRNKNILLSGQESKVFWIQKVKLFLLMLEEKVHTMRKDNAMDRQLLDLLLWLLEVPEVRQVLMEGMGRYLRTLLTGMRPSILNPDHIFHIQKYQQIKKILYQLIFKSNKSNTQARLKQILDKFNAHAFSVLNDESNYAFLDCLCEEKIELQQSVVTDIIKILSNGHIRRTMPAKILIVLAKTIAASLQDKQLSDELLSQCFKSFYQSLGWKMTDPLIGELRTSMCKLFLQLMKSNTWEDQFKNDSIFGLCQQSERNSKDASPMVIEMVYLLIKKFGFSNETKIQSLVPDIFYKVCLKQEFMRPFISLLVSIALRMQFPKATAFIQQMCIKNPSAQSNFYLFQTQVLLKFNTADAGEDIILDLFTSRDKWEQSRIDVNLMMIEIYFLHLPVQLALVKLKAIDLGMLNIIVSIYEEGNYHLLSLICAKVLGSAGGDPSQLEKLQSYNWIRKFSFDILARSFYKATSINVCYIYSSIILRADKPAVTIRWLAQGQFLDYLYQGLNDFLSKEKAFTLQICSSVLVFKLIKSYPNMLPPTSKILQFSTLIKNVGWWDETNNHIEFIPYKNEPANKKWILPEFKVYYEEKISQFFKEYIIRHEEKLTKIKEMEKLVQDDEI